MLPTRKQFARLRDEIALERYRARLPELEAQIPALQAELEPIFEAMRLHREQYRFDKDGTRNRKGEYEKIYARMNGRDALLQDLQCEYETIVRDMPLREWSLGMQVAPGLILKPEYFVGNRVAVLGMPGMGKSSTVSVMAEELAGHIPMTIVDIENEYWSLAEAYPFMVAGKGELEEGLPVPLEASVLDAAKLARECYMGGQSIILCLLNYEEEEREEFLVRYFQQLWLLAQRHRKPHTVIVDEAHEYVPQSGGRSVLQRLVKQMVIRGRKRGLGWIFATQRSAFISKDVLNLCNLLFLHCVQFPHDIALYQWVLPQERAMIENLTVGQAIVRSTGPDGKARVDVVGIRERETRNIGATPTLLPEAVEPRNEMLQGDY